MKDCGIYKITNLINGKIYIGQSIQIFSRWKQHFKSYEDCDKTTYLYNALVKYGIENFSFSIEELCEPELLNEKEKFYIEKYKSFNHLFGYNLTDGGDTPPKLVGISNPNSKLTEDEIWDIRERYSKMEEKKEVYKIYSNRISINTFSDIWIGKTWKHIHYDVYTEENKNKQRLNFKRDKFQNSNFTKEDVLRIRDLRKMGYQRSEVIKQYNFINVNTFNDIWYNKTFKEIESKLEQAPAKSWIRREQDGSKNSMAKFTDEQVRNIRIRKANGENIKNVYKDYSNLVKMEAFRNLWNGKTYKNVVIVTTMGDECNPVEPR